MLFEEDELLGREFTKRTLKSKALPWKDMKTPKLILQLYPTGFSNCAGKKCSHSARQFLIKSKEDKESETSTNQS